MKIKKDYMLHLDVRPGDTIYQYTTVCLHLGKKSLYDMLMSHSDWMDYVADGPLWPIIWWKSRPL